MYKQQPEYSHNHRHRAIIPLMQELRHGEDLILQVYRDKKYSNND
jgi:hypothetical protein